MLGAARTAISGVALLDAVPDHAAAAMSTRGSERLNGALERIESVLLTLERNSECLVIVVAADFADHGQILLSPNKCKRNAARRRTRGVLRNSASASCGDGPIAPGVYISNALSDGKEGLLYAVGAGLCGSTATPFGWPAGNSLDRAYV